MSSGSFYTYLGNRLKTCSSLIEQAEIILIRDALEKRFKRLCPYCKANGHDFNECPVASEISIRCASDGLREKIRGRLSNNIRLASRKPLESHLGKRKKPGFRWSLSMF